MKKALVLRVAELSTDPSFISEELVPLSHLEPLLTSYLPGSPFPILPNQLFFAHPLAVTSLTLGALLLPRLSGVPLFPRQTVLTC